MKITKVVTVIIILALAVLTVWWFAPQAQKVSVDPKADLIRLVSPLPNQRVSSPLTITGEARGNWFFEASFPVFLTNWDGLIIAQGVATAQGDWMTTDFVPFTATLTFMVDQNTYSNRGSLILKKDNPSGLPENDDALEIPVVLAGSDTSANSGVHGVVTLGPTCPAVQNSPSASCADRPYATKVQIFRLTNTTPLAEVTADATGVYSFTLAPGEYLVKALGGTTLPRCESKSVTIQPGVMTELDLSCDTGIR